MRKGIMILGVLVIAMTIGYGVVACDKGATAKQASNDTAVANAGCSKTAAAHDCTGCAGRAGCDKASAKQASADGSGCSKTAAAKAGSADCPYSAAKAVYDTALAQSGDEHAAKEASAKALAEGVYHATYSTTGCAKTARTAAYDAVKKETGCAKTAESMATHAVAKEAYDETLAKTGCSKSAQEAYDNAATTAGKVASGAQQVSTTQSAS